MPARMWAPVAAGRGIAQLHTMPIAYLPDRGVVEVTGEDRTAFLQGLVTNDVAGVAPGTAVFAALLSPQGKWLAEFLILAEGDRLLLDCEAAQAAILAQKLSASGCGPRWSSATPRRSSPCMPAGAVRRCRPGWWPHPTRGCPRPAGAPWPPRRCRPMPHPRTGTATAWRSACPRARATWCPSRPCCSRPDYDELHGVSWTKGCYMGQELTARTKYRGLLKRRLVPVAVDGPLPAPGTKVMAGAAEVGEMRSGRDGSGIAQLRLEALDGRALRCGEAALTPRIPDWMVMPAREPVV